MSVYFIFLCLLFSLLNCNLTPLFSMEGPSWLDDLLETQRKSELLRWSLLEAQNLTAHTHVNNKNPDRKLTYEIRELQSLQKKQLQLVEVQLEKSAGSIEAYQRFEVNAKEGLPEKQQSCQRLFRALLRRDIRDSQAGFDLSPRVPSLLSLVLERMGLQCVQSMKQAEVDYLEFSHRRAELEEEKVKLEQLLESLKKQELKISLTNKTLRGHKTVRETLLKSLSAKEELHQQSVREQRLKSFFQGLQVSNTSQKLKKMTLSSMLPVTGGKVLNHFGRVLDPQSGLMLFKKGVEIQGEADQVVHAIADGKLAFSGKLPHYGHAVLIDHGKHIYSFCAHLGSLSKKSQNAFIRAGDEIGRIKKSGNPVYFELRSGNLAVNPLRRSAN